MAKTVRLDYKTLGQGRFHVFTSPDIKGLHVSAESRGEAERDVSAVVAMIMRERGSMEPVELVWPDNV